MIPASTGQGYPGPNLVSTQSPPKCGYRTPEQLQANREAQQRLRAKRKQNTHNMRQCISELKRDIYKTEGRCEAIASHIKNNQERISAYVASFKHLYFLLKQDRRKASQLVNSSPRLLQGVTTMQMPGDLTSYDNNDDQFLLDPNMIDDSWFDISSGDTWVEDSSNSSVGLSEHCAASSSIAPVLRAVMC